MKKVRVLSVLLTAALTVTSLTVTPSEADAAKKQVSLAKKKVTVAVGQKKKIKIVPAKKKKGKGSAASSSETSKKKKIRAKVKWKSSNKNIARVVKKKVFVKKANARVMGVAPGTAVVKAVYKRKGVKATLKCKVTVVPADATVQSAAPSQSGTPSQSGEPSQSGAPASNAPATDQPGPDKTAKPTKGPTPEPTATPTSNPNTQPPSSPNPWPENADSYSFDLDASREEGGIYSVMNSATWESNADGSVTVTFDKEKNYPDISFRIPAKYYKPNYYKWVEIKYSGNEGNRGLSIYDKGLLPDHDGDPWACDSDTKHDMGSEFLPEYAGDCVKIIALDEIENWTDYATQIDIYAPTGEGGLSAGGKITIKSITLYSDQPGSDVPPSEEPSEEPPATEPPVTEALGAEADATQIDTDITVDGDIEDVWANVPSLPIANYSTAQGETTATAKLAWKADKLNILVEVKDPSIDATSNNNYEQDGIDVFLDEDNSKEAAWDANTDALQYRYSGFTGSSEAETPAKNRLFDHGGSPELLEQIKSAYKVVDGGYVIETSIPLKEAKAEQQMGFELTVFDCAAGKRNNEIWLLNTGNDMTQLWNNHVDWIGTITLKETIDPSVEKRELDLSGVKAVYGQGKVAYNAEDNSVTVTKNTDVEKDQGVQGIFIPLGETYEVGETIKVTVSGSATGTTVRSWLTVMDDDAAHTAQVNPMEWDKTYEYTITGDKACDTIELKKGIAGGPDFDSITITKVVVESKKKEPIATPEPTYKPVEPSTSEEEIGVPVNLNKANVASCSWIDDNTTKYHDGKIDLELRSESSGQGIYIYLKDDHSEVALADYSKIIVDITAEVAEGYNDIPVCLNLQSGIKSNNYWSGGDGTALRGNEQYSGFGNGQKEYEIPLAQYSGKTAAALFVKYNAWYNRDNPPTPLPAETVKFTINSVKLIKADKAEVSTFETETSGNVSLDSSTGYGDVRINEEKFQEFLEFYSDVYTAFDTLNGKEAGQYVTKYTADDEEITYTSSGSGKGTLTVKGGSVDRSLDVEFTKDAGAITGKFTDDKGKVREIKVTESAGSVCNITDNGEEGYKLIVDAQKESDDYTVTYLAPTGDYIKLTKVGNKYALKATKAMIEKYGLSLSYLDEA